MYTSSKLEWLLVMTLVVLISFIYVALSPARANDELLGEPAKSTTISSFIRVCIPTFDTPAQRKAFTKEAVADYCSCASVTLVNRTTQAQYDLRQREGDWDKGWYAIRQEVMSYCMSKYLGLPDVSAIKDKKW